MGYDLPIVCVASPQCQSKLTERTAVWIDGLPYCRPHFDIFRPGERPDVQALPLKEKLKCRATLKR